MQKEIKFTENEKVAARIWRNIDKDRADNLVKIAKLLSKRKLAPTYGSHFYDEANSDLYIMQDSAQYGPCQAAICLTDAMLYHRDLEPIESYVAFLKDSVERYDPRVRIMKLLSKLAKLEYVVTERVKWRNFGWKLNEFNRPMPLLLEIDNIRHKSETEDFRQCFFNTHDAVMRLERPPRIMDKIKINVPLTDEDRKYIHDKLKKDDSEVVQYLARFFTAEKKRRDSIKNEKKERGELKKNRKSSSFSILRP